MTDAEAHVADAEDDRPSSEEEHKPIPYDRFKEVNEEKNEWKQRATQEAEDRRRMEEELKALRDDVAKLKDGKPQQRDWTREELQAAVDEGKISQAQADSIAEQQMERRLRGQLEKELSAKVETTSAETRLRGEIDAYKEAIPALGDKSSQEWARALAEFNDLAESFGRPKTNTDVLKYELRALKQAFGPASRLKRAKQEADPHQETSGGTPAPKAPSKLNARMKAHYDRMIDKGLYSGYDDPKLKAELKYIR